MKWFLFLFLSIFPLHAKQLDFTTRAEGVILMNAKTGAILFEKNAHHRAFPASTTKIASAIYVLDQHSQELDRTCRATKESIAFITSEAKQQSNYRSPPYWLETGGIHIGIKNGEEFRLYDLLCGMLISSANDASNVIAEEIGGTIPIFMGRVNEYLKKIGCLNTSFNNPHGLHHPDHFTTPYDLAIMTKKGLENPIFTKIVSTVRYNSPQTNLECERTFTQTNKLLQKGPFFYPKAIGVKTGTTQAAGKNLIAAAQENGRCLIAVLLGLRETRNELYQDTIRLFETAFNETKMRRYLLKEGLTDLTKSVRGTKRLLKTAMQKDLYYDFYPSEETSVKAKVKWEISSLPIKAGEKVGRVFLIDNAGNTLQEEDLIAAESLKPNIFYWLFYLISNHLIRVLLIVGISCLVILTVIWRKKNTRPKSNFF
ncbi:MAG: D-alanyl-D-alanine carboxypeptidase family protein [Chlamydiales bacterium]